MKIDKDALIKHKFWILVGLSVPLAAIAILLLSTSISSGIAQVRDSLKKKLAEVTGVKDPKRPPEIAEEKVKADYLVGEETKVWAKAFKEQEHLFVWSRAMEKQYHFADGFFANDVQIIKDPGKKEDWPADKTFDQAKDGALLDHGKLQWANEAAFGIIDRNGKPATFHVTPGLIRAGVKEEGGGDPIEYQRLSDSKYKDRLIAIGYQQARYFNDRLINQEQHLFGKTYHSQIPPIIRLVDPLHRVKGDDGKETLAGVVQFKGGWMFHPEEDKGYDEIPREPANNKLQYLVPPENSKYLRFRFDEWNIKGDISTEAWIAQEDLWVQTEIYRLIRTANDSLAKFHPVDPKKAEGKPGDAVVFYNSYFDLSVKLQPDKKALEVTIANRLDRRQKIDSMKLRVRTQADAKSEPDVVTINGDPLDPRGSKGAVRQVVLKLTGTRQRDGVYAAEQVLTWETAAVKRIDQIAIGSLEGDNVSFAQKEIVKGLRPLVKVETAAAPSDSSPTSSPTGGGSGGSGRPGFGGQGGFVPGEKGGGGADTKKSDNGFVLDRYQEVTDQYRRIPVGVVVIVDQNHVDRVLNAFNNSKLRFLMTQSILNHYPHSLKPASVSDKPETPMGGDVVSGGGAKPPMGGFGSFGGFKPGQGFGPGSYGPGSTGPGSPGSPAVDNMEANMELVIYGVVTLYERYPPLPKAGAAASAAPAKAP